MRVLDLLDQSGVNYEVTEHRPTFTAQHMAAEEHEKGKFVAKPVILKADGKFVMCVLSACCKIDLHTLKEQLGASSLELAEEPDIARIFNDCEVGAEPPFGNLYDLPTIIDKELSGDDHITFQAGTHKRAIRMTMDDYRRLAQPSVLDISYHVTT